MIPALLETLAWVAFPCLLAVWVVQRRQRQGASPLVRTPEASK